MGNHDVFIGNVIDFSEEIDAAIFRAVSTTQTNKLKKYLITQK
jgi:hypothetical protein